jgi:hypothetical protein
MKVRKRYQKIHQNNPKPTFSRFCFNFNHVLGRFAFLGEGSSKTRSKKSKNIWATPGTFLAPEEPTNRVKARHRHFLF